MYHPTTRVLVVLELLQAHGRMTGPEIAERLEVDLRTVRRYVTMLQDLGIPVEAERGRYGGYRLLPGYRLPPLMLTDDEALAVTLGLRATLSLGLAAAGPAVHGALAKVERVLPPDVRRRVNAVQQTLTIDLDQQPLAPATETLLTFAEAARERRQVWMRYASGGGVVTERVVDPYGLVHLVGRWYVAGYCHLRADQRVFRLDRVETAQLQADSFTPPPSFDALEFVRASLAESPWDWQVEALLQTTLETARRRAPAHRALLDATDEGVVIRINVDDLDWAARFLIGLGCPFVIREPPELRVVLRALAAELAAAANGESPVAGACG
ncbi:MAG TPA: YafY family protein [Thermomicrobiales bacterium]|nr:YafY family protein [Thermomicrobiales bacterium]